MGARCLTTGVAIYEALDAVGKSGLRTENFRMDIAAAYTGEEKKAMEVS